MPSITITLPDTQNAAGIETRFPSSFQINPDGSIAGDMAYQLAGAPGGAGADLAATTGAALVAKINGGSYLWSSIFTGTSIKLQALGPDGVTWADVATNSVTGTTIGVTVGQGATLRVFNPNATAVNAVYSSIA